jgi:hypothetical protein
VVAVFFAGLTSAGEFVTANYGNTKVKDFQDLVTRDFTARFPADSWELFIYSEAFSMTRSGQAICNAIVGVVPKGGPVPASSIQDDQDGNGQAWSVE